MNNKHNLQVGDIVYHRSVYQHMEPLKILAITEDKILLEGDFSGGTHNVCQRDWLPIKGTSRIQNYAFKEKARKDAIALLDMDIPCEGCEKSVHKAMMDMVYAVRILTSDVSMNPEF